MPVSRGWINQLLQADPVAWRATTDLANHADALEQSLGVEVLSGQQAGAALRPAPPAPSAWTIAAGSGHFAVALTPPSGAPQSRWIQYELQSATDTNFNANSNVSTFTLGLGATTLDVVDPGVTKFWRARWRTLGSSWSGWRNYASAGGVVALSSGPLKTS